MLQTIRSKSHGRQVHHFVNLALVTIACSPTVGWADIIWTGSYETGTFEQWHLRDDPDHPQFAGIPKYGRPLPPVPFSGSAAPGYYGNGELAGLVTSPVREGRYAARFMVKSSSEGSEPDDCDNGVCDRRRSELNMHLVHQPVYAALPYLSERWISVSHYLPSNWNSSDGSSWGPIVFQMKSPRTNSISPMFSIIASNNGWQLYHRWSDTENPNSHDLVPWQYQMYYDASYPASSTWSDGLGDFPDVEVSRRALADLNKGGWTDWVINVRFDARGVARGGSGFLTVWKRSGDEDWIKVLDIRPKQVSRGGMIFDRGIGYEVPGSGFGLLAGLYMAKNQVWGLSENRVVYNDNVKIGSANSLFSEMSPDGSSPGTVGTRTPATTVPSPPQWTAD